MKSPPRLGFTLVELLVVIGIIAVLVAILLPALARARQSVSTLKCLSNQRQIGFMFTMYAQDNNGYLPPLNWKHDLDPSIPNFNSYGMVHCLGPYMGQQQWSGITMTSPYIYLFDTNAKAAFANSVFVCPDYSPIGYTIQPYLSGIAESSYLLKTSPTSIDNTLPRRLTQARRPSSSLIHVADSYQDYVLKDRANLLSGGRSFDIYRHNNGRAANILFLDGHAETLQSGYILSNLTSKMTLE